MGGPLYSAVGVGTENVLEEMEVGWDGMEVVGGIATKVASVPDV